MNKKYILQPYKGISTRHTCPACHHKLEFSLYIDTITGKSLHSTVGKCNRVMNCGYHYSPADYFKDNPNRQSFENYKTVYQPKHEKEKAIDYLPQKFIPNEVALSDNNLFKFFCSKFGKEESEKVFKIYKVGTSKHWMYEGGLSSVFPQIDINGHLRQIKVIAYNPNNGHRLHKEHIAQKWCGKEYIADSTQDKVWFAGKTILHNYDANLVQCFFGEHLIAGSERVAVVESEKTAMIASLYLPEFTWIATGGKNGCRWTSEDVFSVLLGKKIFLYPDLKCLEDWKNKSNLLKDFGIKVCVSQYLEKNSSEEDKNRGLDIADFLLENKQKENNKGFKTIGELIEFANKIGALNQLHIRL